jgi:catechol 2,3-dioxygenase-like lactoylglutathione lyase family enzyme
MQLDHFNITGPMELLDRARDFYRDVLGLEDGFRPTMSKRGYWLYSEGKALVHLYEGEPREPLSARGLLDHIALACSNADAMIAKLQQRGLDYRISRVPEIGLTQIFVRDPAGIMLELNCTETNGTTT